MRETIKNNMMDLMLIPGLSGHEDRVRRALKQRLSDLDIESTSDRLGNLHTHFPGLRAARHVIHAYGSAWICYT